MNEQVAIFIEKQKQKQREEYNREKNEHLLQLGLVDEKSAQKEYLEGSASQWYRECHGYIHCDEKGWYKNGPVPLDISDEEYEEICKICPPPTTKKNESNENSSAKTYYSYNLAETFITVFAWLNLILTIIIVIFALSNISDSVWAAVLIGIGGLLSTMLTWALPLILVNISLKLDNL